jgi:transposase
MKFIRRHDLTPYTRIEMVRVAWLNQGIYGKMTQIAQDYHISRTFLYQLIWAANLQLETLFSDQKPHVQAPHPLFEPFILLLRLEGKCSIPSMSSILKYFQYQPNSVGYLSECFQPYGAALPSTLSMAEHKVVFYLSDEIFARHQPILVTIEAQSTAILKIQLASERSAETWKAHFDDLGDHRFHSIGMASDRGRGLVTGYQAACPDAQWVCDRFHEFQDLFDRRRQLERKAYAAIAKEDEAAQTFHNAKSEANLHKRLQHYEHAHQACEQAIARYDQLDLLLHLLRDALHLCSPFGRLRTVAGVRSELRLLLSLIEEIDDAVLPKLLHPIRSHLDDILAPFAQAESMHVALLDLVPQQTLDALVLAWHHEHLSYQSHAKQKRYHQHESQQWLDFAEGLLDNQFEPLKAVVFEKLDAIVQASSLVELVNSFIRPYLNSSKGQITQETLNLIMFYHNHRRYKSGKRQGKAPIELLTGEALEADWVALLIRHTQEVSQGPSLTSSAPLALVPHRHEHTTPSQTPPGQAILESSTESALSWSPMDAEAA